MLDHVSIFGRAAGSLMVGDFNVQQSEFNNNGTTPLTACTELSQDHAGFGNGRRHRLPNGTFSDQRRL